MPDSERVDDPNHRPTFNDVRDDYDDEFGIVRTPQELALRKIQIPAYAFIVLAVMGIIGGIIFTLWTLSEAMSARPWRDEIDYVIYMAITLAGMTLFALIGVGGVCMLRLRHYGLAIAAAIGVVMLAGGGCYGVFAFPFGIWALIALFQPDMRAAFGRPVPLLAVSEERNLQDARRRLRVSSIAIIIIGLLAVIGSIFGAIGIWVEHYRYSTDVWDFALLVFGSLIVLAAGGLSLWAAFGGWHMMNLRRRKQAFFAAYFVISFSLVPIYSLLLIPFGIWALVLLHRPEIKRAFAHAQAISEPYPSAWRSLLSVLQRLSARTCLIVGSAGLLLACLNACSGVWAYVTAHSPDDFELLWDLGMSTVVSLPFLGFLARGIYLKKASRTFAERKATITSP